MNEDIIALRRELTQLRSQLGGLESRSRQGWSTPTTAPPAVNATTLVVEKATHGFIVGDVLRLSGTTWVKAQADSAANSVVGGIVSAVLGTNAFVVTTGGYVAGLTGLTSGIVHYLSAATAGALTTTAPTIVAPVLIATSTTSGILSAILTQQVSVNWPNPGTSAATVLTSGTTVSFSNKNWLMAYLIGGGGGAGATDATKNFGYVAAASGGSPTTLITGYANAGGGGSGGYCAAIVNVSGLTSFSYTIGAAGGSATDGGDTTLSVGGVAITCTGGKKGTSADVSGSFCRGGRGGIGGLVTVSNAITLQSLVMSHGRNGKEGLWAIGGSTAGGSDKNSSNWPSNSEYGNGAAPSGASVGIQGAIAYNLV